MKITDGNWDFDPYGGEVKDGVLYGRGTLDDKGPVIACLYAMKALKEEKINKVSLIAFTENDIGNAFWNTIGWTERLDLNYYDFTLNEENITAFNGQ